MALYSELYDLFVDDSLRNRCAVALVISAQTLLSGTPTASDQKWAAAVFENPGFEGRKALSAILAANADQTVAAIQGANDAILQTQVDAIAPDLVAAYNAA